MLKHTLAALLASASLVSAAAAQSFTGQDVERFLDLANAMQEIGDKYPDDEMSMALRADLEEAGGQGLPGLLDDEGRLAIFETIVEALEQPGEGPAEKDMRKAVKEAGFKSLPAFADKGDAMMMAFMALMFEEEGGGAAMAEMADLDPSMMAMMPPQMREQIDAMMKMAAAVDQVPAADIDTMRPYRARFEAMGEGR